jgi:tRNA (adenine57-N1/adenine58-N1)-methyltransferase
MHLLDLNPDDRILEAGTGTGSLTLHLSRILTSGGGSIVSVDLRQSHLDHAKKFISRYQQGQYLSSIEFVQGDLGEVVSSMDEGKRFDGVVLDLLNPWDYMSHIVKVLRPDGTLVVYTPNITQGIKMLRDIRRSTLPLALEKCIEVTHKEWVVKPVTLKWPEAIPNANCESLTTSAGEDKVCLTSNVEANDWICRPTHIPAGHTAFLLQFRCLKSS